MTKELEKSHNGQHYRLDEQRVVVECARRYGVKPAFRLLEQMWPNRHPAVRTIRDWVNHHPEMAPEARDEQFWDTWEGTHRGRLQAELAVRISGVLETMDGLMGPAATAEEARGIKDLAIATGILYDKLVPQSGGGISIIGGSPNFHINTYGPAAQLPAVSVIEGASREV